MVQLLVRWSCCRLFTYDDLTVFNGLVTGYFDEWVEVFVCFLGYYPGLVFCHVRILPDAFFGIIPDSVAPIDGDGVSVGSVCSSTCTRGFLAVSLRLTFTLSGFFQGSFPIVKNSFGRTMKCEPCFLTVTMSLISSILPSLDLVTSTIFYTASCMSVAASHMTPYKTSYRMYMVINISVVKRLSGIKPRTISYTRMNITHNMMCEDIGNRLSDAMPLDQTKKRNRISYRYNILKEKKLKKLKESGYFNDYTEIIDEGIELLYGLLILGHLPEGFEVTVEKPKETEKK